VERILAPRRIVAPSPPGRRFKAGALLDRLSEKASRTADGTILPRNA
jgi:hypothetical protein